MWGGSRASSWASREQSQTQGDRCLNQIKPRPRSVIVPLPPAPHREPSLRSHKNAAPGWCPAHSRVAVDLRPSTRRLVSPLGQLELRGQHTSRRGERARFRGGSRRWRRGAAGLPWPNQPPYASLWRFFGGRDSERGALSRVLLPRRDEVAALSTAVGKLQRRLNGLAQGALALPRRGHPPPPRRGPSLLRSGCGGVLVVSNVGGGVEY